MFRIPKKLVWIILALLSPFLFSACSTDTPKPTAIFIEEKPTVQPAETELFIFPAPTETRLALPTETTDLESKNTATPVVDTELSDEILADVISVTASGNENAYNFSVEIRSPDTGCEQYADWWEVLTEDGELIYRRILTHSHVNEQPFTRSGGPVKIGPETVVIIRAHMYPTGYGGTAFRGSVFGHFEEIQLPPNFATELEEIEPLPEGCAF